MPEPAKFESVPPATETIAAVKLAGVSLSVNVSTVASPALSAVLSAVIASEGATMSIVMGEASAPAVFGLPAASLKLPALTEIVPIPLMPTVGVKVAV